MKATEPEDQAPADMVAQPTQVPDLSSTRAARERRADTAREELNDAQTMAGLVAAARSLGEANTEPEVLAVVDRYATMLMGIRSAGLSLVEPEGHEVRTISASFTDNIVATFDVLPTDHPLPAVRTAVTGVAHFLPDLATTTRLFPGCEHIYRAAGIEALAIVPLRARGRLLGSLSVGRRVPHAWRPVERDLLDAFAALTAQTLDRISAHHAEQAATELARRAAAQQGALVDIARALDHTHTEDEVLQVVTRRGVSLLGTQGAVLCLRGKDPRTGGVFVRALTSSYFTDEVSDRVAELPENFPLPMVDTAATGTAHFLADRAAAVAAFPGCGDLYAAADTEASASVPLHGGGAVIGSLSVAFDRSHDWTPAERALLEAFAAVTGQALARNTSRDAEIAASAAVARFSETLQRSLLTSPPQPEDLQIAVRYSPAAAEAQVGGDWYDAFVTPGGITNLVIGDVTGHDHHAAASMAQLRNLLRGVGFMVGAPPSSALTALDRTAHGLDVRALASIVLAQVDQPADHIDAGTRILRWSNAGHPPPLLLEPGAAPRFLKRKSDLLVGVDPDTSRHDHTEVLTPGATVLLYTDGLVERRGVHLQEGLDWLAHAAGELAHPSVEDLCDALLTQIGNRTDDDVALLAMRAQRRPLQNHKAT